MKAINIDSIINSFDENRTVKNCEGYTGHAWRGVNCPAGFLPVKEVAKYIREFIKSDKELNACKWSVTCQSYSGGQSLTVTLVEAPFAAICEKWGKVHGFEYSQHGDCEGCSTPEAYRLFMKIKKFATSFNHDDSDGMIDYFDRGFYDKYYIGAFDRPFKIVEKKAKPTIKSAKPEKTDKTTAEGVQIIDYSEKSVAVIGNTYQIKDILKKLGGKFNARLSCGAGWIFSKSKKDVLFETLKIA